ncbi:MULTISPECIES: hypothetical protein [Protofrankia]|uniref:Uncharacterized protein n=1 Tax=Candidatus Protofrankia datiscae TaxID=2716812 RepID=F8B422_9ACTN|nr:MULTISPECIES: hypothetical protein [Protofrankia]AEH10039.1 hypothetical protein FsymDg_2689 [Candidatus Protofrankia datiscae]
MRDARAREFALHGGSHSFLLTTLIIFWIDYRIVVVTDQSILVLRAGKLVPSKPKGDAPLARLPRQTVLGPLSGLWGKTQATGEKLNIHKRFHKDIAAADAAIGSAS